MQESGVQICEYMPLDMAWFLDEMVAHFTLRTHEGKWVFSGKNTRFDDSFDVTKCLQQIEKPDLLNVCA